MKIYHKYIIKEFFTVLIYSVISFVMVLLFTELFENLRMLLETKTSFYTAFRYYMYRLPYFVIQVLPISTFLSILFTSNFRWNIKPGEYTSHL